MVIISVFETYFLVGNQIVSFEIRKIIDDSSSGVFPLKEIINSAKSNPTKNYSFDDAIIEGLFEVQCGSDDAFLYCLYSIQI